MGKVEIRGRCSELILLLLVVFLLTACSVATGPVPLGDFLSSLSLEEGHVVETDRVVLVQGYVSRLEPDVVIDTDCENVDVFLPKGSVGANISETVVLKVRITSVEVKTGSVDWKYTALFGEVVH